MKIEIETEIGIGIGIEIGTGIERENGSVAAVAGAMKITARGKDTTRAMVTTTRGPSGDTKESGGLNLGWVNTARSTQHNRHYSIMVCWWVSSPRFLLQF